MIEELNPNHEVTQTARELWPKFFLIYMQKMGVDHVVLSMDDVKAALASDKTNIAVQELADGVHFRLVSETEARKIARREGGLPT